MGMRNLVAGSILLLAFTGVTSSQPPGQAGDGDKNLQVIRDYLQKTYPNKKWQSGPTAISTPAIKKVFGEQAKFYYVFSSPPLPPGAPLPELIKNYQNKFKDWQENYISLTMQVDAGGSIKPLKNAKDFNQALPPVKTEVEAQTTTAAVLSLFGSDRVGPGEVKLEEVKMTKTPRGWQGQVQRKNAFVATVMFDEKGQVAQISKTFAGPFPP